MDKATQEQRRKLVRLEVTASQVVAAATAGLKSKQTEKAAGYCYRWVRQVFQAAGVSVTKVPPIATARIAYSYFESRGWAMPLGTVPKAGDILFKVRPIDGVHGHVGIVTAENFVAENSTAHITSEDDQDARGVRHIVAFSGARVVRPPYLRGD